MAGRKKGAPNKSLFIRGVLESNSKATAAEVAEAWKKAGNSGTVIPTLYYQVKRKMGLGRKGRRGRPRKGAAAPAAATGANHYLSIEQKLDALIAQAMEARDGKLAEGLRAARRIASSHLV